MSDNETIFDHAVRVLNQQFEGDSTTYTAESLVRALDDQGLLTSGSDTTQWSALYRTETGGWKRVGALFVAGDRPNDGEWTSYEAAVARARYLSNKNLRVRMVSRTVSSDETFDFIEGIEVVTDPETGGPEMVDDYVLTPVTR